MEYFNDNTYDETDNEIDYDLELELNQGYLADIRQKVCEFWEMILRYNYDCYSPLFHFKTESHVFKNAFVDYMVQTSPLYHYFLNRAKPIMQDKILAEKQK